MKKIYDMKMEAAREENERLAAAMCKAKDLEVGLVGQEFARSLSSVQGSMDAQKGEVSQWAAQLIRGSVPQLHGTSVCDSFPLCAQRMSFSHSKLQRYRLTLQSPTLVLEPV